MTENQTKTATVDFHGHTLITVRHNGIEYVAMKSVVEGMGLDWKVQHRKIVSSKRYGHIAIPLATSGGIQEMLCIPLAKLNGWLFSVSPEKVRPELRDTVIMYQEECFAVLYDYWHKGAAVNPRHEHRQTTVALLASEAESAKRLAGTLEIGDTRVVPFINAVLREIYDTDCLRLAEQAEQAEISLTEPTEPVSGKKVWLTTTRQTPRADTAQNKQTPTGAGHNRVFQKSQRPASLETDCQGKALHCRKRREAESRQL